MGDLEKVKKLLSGITEADIHERDHYKKQKEKRADIDKAPECLLNGTDNLINAETQEPDKRGELKYKLDFSLSGKYSLIIIISIIQTDVYIISAWKENKKWQKALQK
jgi:hypothetical protein